MTQPDLETAAGALVDTVETALASIEGLAVFGAVHGMRYDGPDLSGPLDDVRRALGRPTMKVMA